MGKFSFYFGFFFEKTLNFDSKKELLKNNTILSAFYIYLLLLSNFRKFRFYFEFKKKFT